ncbi:MAG: oxidoreductase [Pseudomonadota bacterium]|nr:aldo/keto reductase [Rubrivivax sp.]NLZ41783.1 aldo/keto reductase [Comamonadaceae bacterium]
MKYVRLGASGLEVSRIGLGMMSFGSAAWRPWIRDEAAARAVVRRAVELGINFFDTADLYSAGLSEQITGRVLREFARRDEIVIATKVFHPVLEGYQGGQGGAAGAANPALPPNAGGLSRKHILAAVDASLQRLGVGHIDLYQIHRFDPATPVEETMATLDGLVRAGKVRYLGASSMWTWQFAKLQHAAGRAGDARFVAMQSHYNLAYREEEREMIPYCRDSGVGVVPWSPLARGFLAGNRTRDDRAGGAATRADRTGGAATRAESDALAHRYYYRDADFAVAAALGERARRLGLSNAALAYAWLLQRPGVASLLAGAGTPQQLDDAVRALDVALAADDIAALEAPYLPHAVMGHA